QMDDSLRAVEDATAIAVLQVLHDVEQREVDNAALREQIGTKERTILAQRTDNGILIALVAALAILLVLLGISALAGTRMMRRMKLKNAVIRKQHAEIEAQHRELVIQNERLAESILGSEEKELLLKEIHHRMKNNLQVVESLLGIQMGRHGDPVLERQAPGRGSLQDHFNRLGRSVLVSFGLHDRVSFQADVTLTSLSEEQLLPLTLLVNELLTNAGKHAFEGLDQGHIHLQLRQQGQQMELLFQDNGIGRNGWTGTAANTFGSELIGLLSEQLNGTLERSQQEGGQFKLVFGEAAPLRKAS
ncbi:MAG: sensor histidine kinase, partial [Flavobacteriales bacterium]|nr:sensor histidine kinase [Flavobacteriales bacterium]